MDLNGRIWIVVAGISGLLAVALGAYGAHGLDGDAVVIGGRVVHGSHAALDGERVAFSPLYEWQVAVPMAQ